MTSTKQARRRSRPPHVEIQPKELPGRASSVGAGNRSRDSRPPSTNSEYAIARIPLPKNPWFVALPELGQPIEISTPASTLHDSGASTSGWHLLPTAQDNREFVPVGFSSPDLLDESVVIKYGRVGDVESRTAVYIDEATGTTRGELMKPGTEKVIPDGVQKVITNFVGPLEYPKDCPKITKELLATTEPTGPGWIKNGRAKFIHGVMMGRIPRHCTTRPFFESKLGLRQFSHRDPRIVADFLVIVCPHTGGVRKFETVDTADGQFDINSDDSDSVEANFTKSRWTAPIQIDKTNTTLFESPDEARSNDPTRRFVSNEPDFDTLQADSPDPLVVV